MTEIVSIHLLKQGKTLYADSGQSLLESLMHHGIILRSDCGGKGRCGKCKVDILNGDGRFETVDSCTYTVERDSVIQIPESSILPLFIMDKARLSFPDSFKHRFTDAGAGPVYGVAVDLGTTTMAVYLCDILKGEAVSSIALKNPQALHGADVMSRITAVAEDEKNLEKLQRLTVQSIEWGIQKLLKALKGAPASISKMVVVGNPAMIHIITGTDPKSIGIAPYQPAFHEARCFDSQDLQFNMKGFKVYTLPNISGFLGGDILAAAQAADMESQPDGTLLIDLGTNGELMLKHKNSLHATSCATGPAFEGATLSCGIQATTGAINAIEIDDSEHVTGVFLVNSSGASVAKPSGICGAGVINAVAQFCRKKIIRPDGAFRSGQDKFILVPENSESGQSCIHISQKDIRSVQLGKSALITGITFLMKRAGISKLEKLIIAGAFGAYLNTSDLKRLGMIPDMDDDKIDIAGNLAGSGAVMALCDERYIHKTTHMSAEIETVDLACDTQFQEAFINNLSFPA
ncbi:MAG: DUF4445 domain-containing protein [Proteobacteria bacterium]|nr:DUF4445 domain-containing protein [Pseudomonadota bacterium]